MGRLSRPDVPAHGYLSVTAPRFSSCIQHRGMLASNREEVLAHWHEDVEDQLYIAPKTRILDAYQLGFCTYLDLMYVV